MVPADVLQPAAGLQPLLSAQHMSRTSEARGGGASPTAGSVASQAAAAPPLSTLRLASMRRLEQVAAVAAVLMQITLWTHSAATLDFWQHMRQAASVGVQLLTVWLAFLFPHHLWLKFRVHSIALARVVMATVPNNRATGEGLALLLERPASPGLLGALTDYLRVASGTRVLAMALAVVVLQQPTLAVLLEQCAVMALTSNNRAYCSCKILADPLSHRRMATLWGVLELAPIFVPPQGAAAAGALGGPADTQHLCVSLLNMHQLVCGILLPTLLAAYTEHYCSPGRRMQPRSGQLEQQQQQQHRGETRPGRQRGSPVPPGSPVCRVSWRSGLLASAARAWATVDARLQDLCLGAGCCSLQVVLAAWLLLGNLWLLARAAAA